jgi:hypothetical protein
VTRVRIRELFDDRIILRVFLLVVVVVASSWSQEAQIEVRELVDGGTKYTNRLVTAHGCLVKEFEIRVLQPCGTTFNQFSKYSIWVDEIDRVTEDAERTKTTSFIQAQSAAVLKNGRGDLWKSATSRDRPLAVTLEGEFQVSGTRKFGHLDFYRRRLIVHRYLKTADSGKRSVN